MTDVSNIYLLDGTTNQEAAAELRDAIETQQLLDWQATWQPALAALLTELHRRGVPPDKWPQSWHWDWPKKVAQVKGLLAFKGFSVICGGMTQGMMRTDLNGLGRIQSQAGKPLVSVEYVEVAPWNRPELGQSPRLRGVGTALITAAVELSIQEGFGGRIGLHSLPQAEDFYRKKCGMTDLGPDAANHGLRYFEFTAAQATAFLGEE